MGRTKRLGRQLVIMLDDKTADRIEAEAEAEGMAKSVIAREYLLAGIAAADAPRGE